MNETFEQMALRLAGSDELTGDAIISFAKGIRDEVTKLCTVGYTGRGDRVELHNGKGMPQEDLDAIASYWKRETNYLKEKLDQSYKAAQIDAYARGYRRGREDLNEIRKQRDELLAALLPFSKLLQEHHERLPDTQPIYGIGDSLITVGDLRKAVNLTTSAKRDVEAKTALTDFWP